MVSSTLSKTGRSLGAAPDENVASAEARRRKIPFDPAVWQNKDDGSFVNVRTGEIREPDDFADDPGDETYLFHSDDWKISQDVGGFADSQDTGGFGISQLGPRSSGGRVIGSGVRS